MAYSQKKTQPNQAEKMELTATNKDKKNVEKSVYWETVEVSDFNTYVINIKSGIVIKTESENGVAMCFVPNTRFTDGKFEKIV